MEPFKERFSVSFITDHETSKKGFILMLFYYPNRPILIPPDPMHPMDPQPEYLRSLEASGKYVGELKWNGDNTLVYTDDLSLWNRRHERLHYQPSPEVLEELSVFPKGSIINLETVNSKTKTVKDKLVVHCVMAWKGKLLTGKTWGDSRKILEDFGKFGPHVVLSETFKTGFWERYKSADGAIIEGIILKDPNGRLVFSTTPIKDVSWMLKVRKACKKYPF